MYRFTIFDENIKEVQTLLADAVSSDGTMVGFITDNEIEMVYNLPAGYSILKEDAD
jgi:hypothetical protein